MMKKGLCIFMTLALLFSLTAVNVCAAEEGTILKEFKGIEAGLNGDTSFTSKNEETGALTIDLDYGGHAYGYATDVSAYEGKVIKTAFYLKVEEVDNSAARMRINPFLKGVDPWLERWVDVSYGELSEYEGEKIIVVGAYTIAEGVNELEARLWFDPGVKVTIDKVMIATNEYNFANDPDYELITEWVDESNDPEAADEMIESVRTVEKPTAEPTAPAETTAPAEKTQAPAQTPEVTTAKPTATATPAATVTNSPASSDADNNSGNTALIVVIVVVVLAAAGGAAFYFIKKKKR